MRRTPLFCVCSNINTILSRWRVCQLLVCISSKENQLIIIPVIYFFTSFTKSWFFLKFYQAPFSFFFPFIFIDLRFFTSNGGDFSEILEGIKLEIVYIVTSTSYNHLIELLMYVVNYDVNFATRFGLAILQNKDKYTNFSTLIYIL